MSRSRTKRATAFLAGVAAAAMSSLVARGDRDPVAHASRPPQEHSTDRSAVDHGSARAQGAHPAAHFDALAAEDRALLDGLARRDPRRLEHVRARIELLEDLVRWLREHRPEIWRTELARLLRAAFPDDAEDLLALWDARESYELWMREHERELAGLPPGERRRRSWEARRDFFGDDADQLFESVRRNEAIADALSDIDAHSDGPIDTRFRRYLDAIEEQYRESTPRFVEARRQEITERFVGLESVQAELAALAPDERSRELRALRAEAGMDEAALARWDDLDRQRDERWEASQRYMAARRALTERLRGRALEDALDALRARYFGPEAEIVAGEEASGYFRAERPRRYGLN